MLRTCCARRMLRFTRMPHARNWERWLLQRYGARSSAASQIACGTVWTRSTSLAAVSAWVWVSGTQWVLLRAWTVATTLRAEEQSPGLRREHYLCSRPTLPPRTRCRTLSPPLPHRSLHLSPSRLAYHTLWWALTHHCAANTSHRPSHFSKKSLHIVDHFPFLLSSYSVNFTTQPVK